MSVLLCGITLTLLSCATTDKSTALVDDPTGKEESAVPWNKPENWESGGALTGITDRR